MTRTRQTEPAQAETEVAAIEPAETEVTANDLDGPNESQYLRYPACERLEITGIVARQIATAIIASPHGWQSLGGDVLDGHTRDGKPLGIYLAERCHALATDFTARLLDLQTEHHRQLLAEQIAADAPPAQTANT